MCSLFTTCTLFLPTAFGQPASLLASKSTTKQSLHFATTDWCPYICDDENSPGFIIEYLTKSLAAHNISLEISIFPWSRAIHMAQTGAVDGLATATEVEAPGFLFTEVPTGSYQMCFYSQEFDEFTYSDRASLSNKAIGAIKGYGYGEPIDSMIAMPLEHEKITLLATSNPLYSLIGMLEASRIELFIEDEAVVRHFLNQNAEKYKIRKAGCLDQVPFYTAISPNNDNGILIAEKLSRILASDLAHTYYLNARKRYGLE
ncbi:substrate-binding periplasmic protein [Alkalimarinus coralli]|uniref:substrate-binding periplasmic protein n=1 Tax=Alkalimarinus coralli TaxID=2935863 RepID=UPI00202B5BB6|nr:transporter substrate-binding domain-containing protein [Alkalimarinus coralli]